MQEVREISRVRSFGGWIVTCEHMSRSCRTPMRFAIYLPPQSTDEKVAAVYWLSGLTCTEENFMVKAGAQRFASELELALIAPDTSPRETGIPGEDDEMDIGTGAGFYVNATEQPWAEHYRMYDYVFGELVGLVEQTFPVNPGKRGISGHSMGGHGALIGALSNPGLFHSISVFAPICAPAQCPWGQKAFGTYLGNNRKLWESYDATHLVRTDEQRLPILVDQGSADPFLEEQLLPEKLAEVCKEIDYPIDLRYQDGYDHSYFFIASFIEEHLQRHADVLRL